MFSLLSAKAATSNDPPAAPIAPSPSVVLAPSKGKRGIRKFWTANKTSNSAHTHDYICSSAVSVCNIILGQKSANTIGGGSVNSTATTAPSSRDGKENVTTARVMNVRRKGEMEVKPVPVVSRKAFRKLKGELVKPVEARRIIVDLKRMDTQEIGNPGMPQGAKRWIMPLLDDQSNSSLSTLNAPTTPSITVTALSTISPAFSTVLETASGVISNLSGSSKLTAAFDRPTIFIYWWGYEIALPPPSLDSISKAHSVSSYLFTFLTAFVITGGAPELMPYLNYLSTFIDMEFAAIRAQDKGHGVVLAATWLVPIAVVPRPWDFVKNHEVDSPAPSLLLPHP